LGFLAVIWAGVGFVAAGVAAFEYLPSSRATTRLSILLLVGGWLCVGLLLALARHLMRRPVPEWGELGPARRALRVSLTVVGTAIFAFPIGWIAWLIFSR